MKLKMLLMATCLLFTVNSSFGQKLQKQEDSSTLEPNLSLDSIEEAF